MCYEPLDEIVNIDLKNDKSIIFKFMPNYDIIITKFQNGMNIILSSKSTAR